MKLTVLISGGLLAAGSVYSLIETQIAAKPVPPVFPARVSPPVTPNLEAPADAALAVEAHAPKVITLRDCANRLIYGRDWLQTVPDYTAVLLKQERVGEDLRPLETIDLKLRHVPLSVAMSWRENGRIAYFQDHANDGRMLVRMGGWKCRLGWIHLDPHATLAMQESRYPITDVGLLRLTEQLLERFEPFLNRTPGVTCTQLPDEEIGGRLCRVFTVDYATEAVNPGYRRSVLWLDAEWSVPLAVQNFDWFRDTSNPEGLCEYYVYENVRLNCQFSNADFTVEAPRPLPP